MEKDCLFNIICYNIVISFIVYGLLLYNFLPAINDLQYQISEIKSEREITMDNSNSTISTLSSINSEIQIRQQSSNYIMYNPTYNEVQTFLEKDKTNLIKYDIDNFNCGDFSSTVKNNAEKEGIRCGYAYVLAYDDVSNGLPHAIVCFDTIDKGLVYFEPQYDEDVTDNVYENVWTYFEWYTTYELEAIYW